MNRFERMRENITGPHGTRRRYVGGCRCVPCRAANSRYSVERAAAIRAGRRNAIVSADTARRHLLELASKGVGYKTVAAATGVPSSILWGIRQGKRKNLREETERKILATDETIRADRSLIPAAHAWKRLNELIADGYTKTQLAAWLGSNGKVPALQVRSDWITARTASKVERLYLRLRRGELRRPEPVRLRAGA